ncbi:MAG: hypothetical protein ACJAZ3_000437 [Sphingobacteriales bacterium]
MTKYLRFLNAIYFNNSIFEVARLVQITLNIMTNFFKNSLIVVALVASTIFVSSYSDYLTIPTYNSERVAPVNNQGRNVKGIKGAMEYLNEIRVNQITGTIDANDVYNAYLTHNIKASRAFKSASHTEWVEMGPDNIGGRTRAVLVDKDNPARIYAGSVSGGLFISNNSGTTWEPNNDQQANLAVSCITQAVNGDIYYGTGEGHYIGNGDGGRGVGGQGIFKSIDGGENFTRLVNTYDSLTNKGAFMWVNSIFADPSDSNRVYAATRSGLYVTHNAGDTWDNPIGSTIAQDVAVGPSGIVFAAQNGRFYRSVDSGQTFQNLSANVPGRIPTITTNGRIEITNFAGADSVVYVVLVNGQGSGHRDFYLSKDTGSTFSIITNEAGNFDPLGQQGTFNIAMGVNLTNPDKMYIGGQTQNWHYNESDSIWLQGANSFVMHADRHIVANDPSNPEVFYVGTDGGVYRTGNGANNVPSFISRNNSYNVTQYYSVAAGIDGAFSGGAQDNGTHRIDPNISPANAKRATAIGGGDGTYTAISNINPDIYFYASQNGNISRRDINNFASSFPFDENVSATDQGSSVFVTCFRLWEDVATEKSLYAIALGRNIYVTPDALDLNSSPEWFKITDRNIFGSVSRLEFSANGDQLYAGANGRLYRVSGLKDIIYEYDENDEFIPDSLGITVEQVYSNPSRAFTGIGVDNVDSNKLIITLGNYGNISYVFKSNNILAPKDEVEFEDVTGDLPKFPVYDAVIDLNNNAKYYVGTEAGIYSTKDNGVTWEHQTSVPNVPVFMLVQVPNLPGAVNGGVIYAATHGRGVYKTETSTPTSIAQKEKSSGLFNLTVYPNPVTIGANVMVNTTSSSKEKQVSVYSLTGRLITKQTLLDNSASVSTVNWNKGTYLVQVKSEGLSRTQKIIVQ